MSFNPYQERAARVTVTVTRPDSTGAQKEQTYTFEQHRMRIGIREGGNQFGNLKAEIYGVPLDAMNQIARLWLETLTPQNTDTVKIDVWNGAAFTPIFQGVVTWSAVDASNMPDVKLVLEANASFALSNVSASPYTVPDAPPVLLKDALTAIAAPAGFAVDYSDAAPAYSLTNTRVTGSPLTQLGAVLGAFPDLRWFVHLQRIVVLPVQKPFQSDSVRIAADNGMIGNPVYSSSGLQVSTLFNPVIRPGVALDVHSMFDFVNRTVWVANVIAHQLDVNMPGGQWFTGIAASSYGPKGNNQQSA